MKQEGPLDRLRRVCGRIYPKLSSLFRATRPPPAPAARFEKEKETRGNHVVKSLWKPPVEVEATSPAVSLAALELDIMLIDKMVRKLFRALLHGDSDGTMLSTQTPEGRAFIHQQLDELRAEKARYKEEKLALLEKLDNRGGSDHLALISGVPDAAESAPAARGTAAPASPSAPATPALTPASSPSSAPTPAASLPSRTEEDDQKAVERASTLWMNTLTLGTYDAPRKAAELYTPDGVLWGSEVYSADSPLWGTGDELIRNTPGQIYAYYDCFARLPELRVVSHTFSPVRVHGDFAAQDGTHAFAWKGRGGATVEMRIRFSLRFRRDRRRRRNGDDKSCGNEWAIMEHCAFVTMPGASPAEISPLSPPPPPASAVRPDEKKPAVDAVRSEAVRSEAVRSEVVRNEAARREEAARSVVAGDRASRGGDGGVSAVPDSFLLAESGDHEKALARWKATLEWRKESGANVALATPHPRFDFIKKNCPTFFHGKDKTGAVVYYEQLGKIDDKALRRRGLDGKEMLWHYMYQMVYLWTVINPNDADRVTTVLDLRGVTLATATKADTVQFIKQCVTMMATHYPERSTNLLLLSLPRWFDWIFRFIRPLLSESTKNKMTSCTADSVYETLLSKIDNDQIPKEYGGASEYALGEHPYEVAMRKGAVKVLAEKGVAVEPVTC